jgi:hypothetical protein
MVSETTPLVLAEGEGGARGWLRGLVWSFSAAAAAFLRIDSMPFIAAAVVL